MKYVKIIIALLVTLNASSCDFLVTTPQDFVAPSNFYKTPEEAYMALTGLYTTLRSANVYGEKYSMDISSTDDLGYYDRNTIPVLIANNNFGTSENGVLVFWGELYKGINNASFFLENIDRVQMDEKTKAAYRGEAIFLRAYFHFMLAQCFGDVPYKTVSQSDAVNVNIGNTSHKEVLLQVVREMEEAESVVSEIDNVVAGRVNRSAVRGILARVYLKLAGWPSNLGKPMYEKALFWANKVNEQSKHQLNPDYTEVFINYAADVADTKYRESIWEIEFAGNALDAHRSTGRIGSSNGIQNGDASTTSEGYSYGFISCTLNMWDMYNDLDGNGEPDAAFEGGSDLERNHPDVRRDWNMAPFKYQARDDVKTVFWKKSLPYQGDVILDNNGNPKLDANQKEMIQKTTMIVDRNIGKYRREYEKVTPRSKNNTPINFPVLRYADVLLMIAEAANEVAGAPTDEAVLSLQKVRVRSLGEGRGKVSTMSYENFKQFVKDERARELCYEGIRKYDLIRWSDYGTEMKKVAFNTNDSRWSAGKKFAVQYANSVVASERYWWLPIPNKELGLNNLLKQNAAWQ